LSILQLYVKVIVRSVALQSKILESYNLNVIDQNDK